MSPSFPWEREGVNNYISILTPLCDWTNVKITPLVSKALLLQDVSLSAQILLKVYHRLLFTPGLNCHRPIAIRTTKSLILQLELHRKNFNYSPMDIMKPIPKTQAEATANPYTRRVQSESCLWSISVQLLCSKMLVRKAEEIFPGIL